MGSKLRVDVIDPGSPGVDAALVGSLTARPGGCRAVVLGGRGDAERVASTGVEVLAHVPIPGGVPWLAGRRLGRALRDLGVDAVGTWSEVGATAAIRAGCDPSMLEAHVVALGRRTPWLEPWLRDRHRIRPVGLEIGPVLFRRGWHVAPAVPIRSMPVAVARPSIDPPDWRRPGRITVGLHVEPKETMDFGRVSRALAAAAVAGRRLTVVMPDCGSRGREEERWLREVNGGFNGPGLRTIVDDRMRSPELVGDAVDVLVSVPHPRFRSTVSAVALRSWLAHGVPVVAERNRDTQSLVEDGVDGRLISPGNRHAITSILIRLADDESLLSGMRHAAAARHGAIPVSMRHRSPFAHAGGSASMNRDAAPR